MLIFFRKLQVQISFDKIPSFGSNITLHEFRLGPVLGNRDSAYWKILDTSLIEYGINHVVYGVETTVYGKITGVYGGP